MHIAKNKIYNNEGILILLIVCNKAAKFRLEARWAYMGPGRKICTATHGTTADKGKAAIKGRKICIVTHETKTAKAVIKGQRFKLKKSKVVRKPQIGHFRVPKTLTSKPRLSAKMSIVWMRIKWHFHINDFTLRLALNKRLVATTPHWVESIVFILPVAAKHWTGFPRSQFRPHLYLLSLKPQWWADQVPWTALSTHQAFLQCLSSVCSKELLLACKTIHNINRNIQGNLVFKYSLQQ